MDYRLPELRLDCRHSVALCSCSHIIFYFLGAHKCSFMYRSGEIGVWMYIDGTCWYSDLLSLYVLRIHALHSSYFTFLFLWMYKEFFYIQKNVNRALLVEFSLLFIIYILQSLLSHTKKICFLFIFQFEKKRKKIFFLPKKFFIFKIFILAYFVIDKPNFFQLFLLILISFAISTWLFIDKLTTKYKNCVHK